MDLNLLRSVITAVLFVIFLGIVFWAYGKRQKQRFDEAANLPFVEKD